MGTKVKDKNEYEHLRGLVRQLQSENKQLRKQLARSNKEVQRAVETVISFVDDTPITEELVINENIIKCLKCGRKIKGLELGPKILYNCINENCKFRRTVKK